ncbi:MAG: hypothetical protein V4857_00755 [Pseudomonadota bacterium]
MKPRHLAMGAALLVAAGLAVFGDKRPESDVAEPVARAPQAPPAQQARVVAVAAPTARAAAQGEPTILALEERARLIGDDGEAIGARGQVFGTQDWNPPPPPAPKAQPPQAPQPAPAPSAPPLPFAYMGKAVGDGAWEVFLTRGEQTYIVRTKTVIDGTYRVDAIAPPVMTLTYLPLNQVQQLNIGVLD